MVENATTSNHDIISYIHLNLMKNSLQFEAHNLNSDSFTIQPKPKPCGEVISQLWFNPFNIFFKAGIVSGSVSCDRFLIVCSETVTRPYKFCRWKPISRLQHGRLVLSMACSLHSNVSVLRYSCNTSRTRMFQSPCFLITFPKSTNDALRQMTEMSPSNSLNIVTLSGKTLL